MYSYNKTKSRRNKLLKEACYKGDLEKVKYHLTSSKLEIHADPNAAASSAGLKFSPLVLAVISGRVEVVKFLIESEELAVKALVSDSALNYACSHGHTDVLEYLLKCDQLVESSRFGNIVINAANYAVSNGHLHILETIVSSGTLPVERNLRCFNDRFYKVACEYGYLDIVKYLTSSPQLKEHADITGDDLAGFNSACAYSHLEVVDYLIIEKKLEVPERLLADIPVEDVQAYVRSIIASRDLKDKLDKSLAGSPEPKRRPLKI